MTFRNRFITLIIATATALAAVILVDVYLWSAQDEHSAYSISSVAPALLR